MNNLIARSVACSVVATFALFVMHLALAADGPLPADVPLPPPLLSPSAVPSTAQGTSTNDPCDRCGKIESIRQVTVQDQWTPLGSSASSGAGDGMPSGVAVYQIGKGFTNQGQVLLGAAGGGTYRTKPNELNATRWEVVVKMDTGGNRTVTQNYEPMLREGDHVRVAGRQIELLQ
jgi:outer membrane lipoprotein SlyB